jgi:hypothetical protein
MKVIRQSRWKRLAGALLMLAALGIAPVSTAAQSLAEKGITPNDEGGGPSETPKPATSDADVQALRERLVKLESEMQELRALLKAANEPPKLAAEPAKVAEGVTPAVAPDPVAATDAAP